jgi:hypothetical protein
MPFLLLWHPKARGTPTPVPDLDGDRPRARVRVRDDDEAITLAAALLRVISENDR